MSNTGNKVLLVVLIGLLAILMTIFIFYLISLSSPKLGAMPLLVKDMGEGGFFLDAGDRISLRTIGDANSGSGDDDEDTDTNAPGIVTNLTASSIGTTSITWGWTNPTDSDFDGAIVYLDGVFKEITMSEVYIATGLLPSTTHTIRINTIDDDGNINNIDVTDTRTTSSVPGDTTPPAVITGLSVSDKGTNYITWSWTNPTDVDFAENVIYIDGINVANSSSNSYTASGLTASTSYTITINTKDTSGNVNNTNVSDSETTNSIIPGNNAPVADAGVSQIVDENTLVALNGAGSSDVDLDTLTYSWTQTSGTSVTLSSTTSATPTFTAPEVLADTALIFQLIVNDGTVNSASDSVTIIVQNVPVNQAPVANDIFTSTDEDTSKAITLSCTDAENDVLTYSIISSPTNGFLSGTGNAKTYTPNPNFNGADSFTYRCNDGSLNSNTATVSITVTPVNDAAVWSALANKNVNEDLKADKNSPAQASRVIYAGITSKATDIDSPVVMTVASTHSHFTLSIVGNDLIISNVEANWFGSETVTLSANGITATFDLTVKQLLDDYISISGYGGTYGTWI